MVGRASFSMRSIVVENKVRTCAGFNGICFKFKWNKLMIIQLLTVFVI